MLTTYKKATEQGIPTHNIQTLILILIQSWHKEYTTTINKYHILIQGLAKKQNNELIELEQRKTLGLNKSKETLMINPIITLEDNPLQLLAIKEQTDLDSYLPKESHFIVEENKLITEKIKQTNFKFSDKTKQRVTREINEILTHSETEGIGPYQVAEQIKDKFNDLKTWEANRIARTEINRADNEYRFNDIMDNDLIDYVKWHANIDEKTRDSHEHVNGEIVRKGELFSNGLRFPGDPNGPAKEVMNCRCSITPYIPPFDKVIPNKDIFTEEDLIDKPEDAGQQFLLETIENTRIITPVSGGVEVTPDNLKISKVKESLKKLTQQTLDGYIKTKKELQTTLDKFLGVSKPQSNTDKLKSLFKNPFSKTKNLKSTTLEDFKVPSNIEDITKPLSNTYFKRKTIPLDQKPFKQLDQHLNTQLKQIERIDNRYDNRILKVRKKITNIEDNKLKIETKIKKETDEHIQNHFEQLFTENLSAEERQRYDELRQIVEDMGIKLPTRFKSLVDVKNFEYELMSKHMGFIDRKDIIRLHQLHLTSKPPQEYIDIQNQIIKLKSDPSFSHDKLLQNKVEVLEARRRIIMKTSIPEDVRAEVNEIIKKRYDNELTRINKHLNENKESLKKLRATQELEIKKVKEKIKTLSPHYRNKATEEGICNILSHKKYVPETNLTNKEFIGYPNLSKNEYIKLSIIEERMKQDLDDILDFYTDTSKRFNKYIHLKNGGASKNELRRIVKEEFEDIVQINKDKYNGIQTIEQLENLWLKRENELIQKAKPIGERRKLISAQNNAHYNHLNVGDSLPDTGFTSFTLNEDIAGKFANNQINKRHDVAVINAYIEDDVEMVSVLKASHGDYGNEQEYILPPGYEQLIIGKKPGIIDGIPCTEYDVLIRRKK